MRRPLYLLTAATFLTWIGTRMSAVALPLFALEQTGEVWTTGLVGGVSGLPLLTVGWWGRHLRDRITSGRALAVLMTIHAIGLAIVPASGLIGGVSAATLCSSGLITGMTGALLTPAQRSIVADLADGEAAGGGSTSAARWLVWQDLAHRISMIFAPAAGAWLFVAWGAEPLLWLESALFALVACSMLAVPAVDQSHPSTEGRSGSAASMREVLRSHPELALGIATAGVGGICWFGFSLGLAVLGYEVGRPGALVAAGMSGYGGASIAATLFVPIVIDRLPRVTTMLLSWVVLGAAFIALPAVAPNITMIVIVSAIGGAAMPWAIAMLNALISEQTSGQERRTAFAAETIVHSGGASVGLLVGGSIIGIAGPGPVLVATGLVQVAAGLAGLFVAATVNRSTKQIHRKAAKVGAPSDAAHG